MNTVPSASFFSVISEVLPCPVRIRPSPDVYPIAASSPEAVSPVGRKVPEAITSPVTETPACRCVAPATVTVDAK